MPTDADLRSPLVRLLCMWGDIWQPRVIPYSSPGAISAGNVTFALSSIGRAGCRGRVEISVDAASLKKKKPFNPSKPRYAKKSSDRQASEASTREGRQKNARCR